MRIYNVTYHIHISVEAEDEEAASELAYQELERTAENGNMIGAVSEWSDIEDITHLYAEEN